VELEKRDQYFTYTPGNFEVAASANAFLVFKSGFAWYFGLDGNLVGVDGTGTAVFTTTLSVSGGKLDCTSAQCTLVFNDYGDLAIYQGTTPY
jgi:hypothetical protein